MKKVWAAVISILLCAAAALPACGAQAGAPGRVVRVACGINKALYLNGEGQPEGYCQEYLAQLAKINHWQLEYVEASWTDSVRNLQTGKIDLLFPTQMTEERKKTMGFSGAIGGYQPIGLFVRADSDLCFDDYESFNGKKIALSPGTSNEACLKQCAEENGFTYIPVYMNATPEKLEALESGAVDMIVFSTLNDVENGKVVAMLDYLPFYYCTNINDAELLAELDYGMNQMLLRNPVLVQEVFYDFMNRNISFAYTREEKQAIQGKGSIVVGIYEDTPPLYAVDGDGTPEGVYVDLIHKIESLSGLDIQLQSLSRRERMTDTLRKGGADFILGPEELAEADAESGEFVHSDGIMDYYTIAISRPEFTPANDVDMVFALTTGRQYWERQVLEKCPTARFRYYDTSKECLNALQKGIADLTLMNTWEYNYHSKNSRFRDLVEWETSRTLSKTTFLSLQSENELIRSVLNKSIEQITNAEKEGIITANLNNPYEDYNIEDRLFSAKESLIVFAVVLVLLSAGFVMYTLMRRKNMTILQENNRRLAEANEAKTRFLSRMSHELRTPLNAIGGYTAVIEQDLNDGLDDAQHIRPNLEAIKRATQYQLAIIGDLLDIQRIESGKMALTKTDVDVEALLSSIVEMIRPEAEQKKIVFTQERLPFAKELYLLDGVRLQQVLINLLHNAVKFTPQGGIVRLTAERIERGEKERTLKFVVSDNGIGISEDFQQNFLFRRFAQEYSGSTSPYEGCGTGLALSQELVHMMGGEIVCKSRKGDGATFTVTLPAETTGKKRRRARVSCPQYDLSGIRVLLCEDNPTNQDIERHLLEKMGCTVDIAEDGVIGLQKYTESETAYYQVVLMDIRMPNMDGWECARRIRALEREDAKNVLMMAVSANAFEEDVRRSLEAGMNEHMPKPINVSTLCEMILRYVKGPAAAHHTDGLIKAMDENQGGA